MEPSHAAEDRPCSPGDSCQQGQQGAVRGHCPSQHLHGSGKNHHLQGMESRQDEQNSAIAMEAQLPAAPSSSRPVPARSGEMLTLRGPGSEPVAASSMGHLRLQPIVRGVRRAPRPCWDQCSSAQSSSAQLSCHNLVCNSSVPALLCHSSWTAP